MLSRCREVVVWGSIGVKVGSGVDVGWWSTVVSVPCPVLVLVVLVSVSVSELELVSVLVLVLVVVSVLVSVLVAKHWVVWTLVEVDVGW